MICSERASSKAVCAHLVERNEIKIPEDLISEWFGEGKDSLVCTQPASDNGTSPPLVQFSCINYVHGRYCGSMTNKTKKPS